MEAIRVGPLFVVALSVSAILGFSAFAYAQNGDANVTFGQSKQLSLSNPECLDRLRSFVTQIDDLMESSSSIDPLQKVINEHFPLSACDTEQAIAIAKTSKYFDSVSYAQKEVVILFRTNKPGRWGFKVSFGLKKSTGDSLLPNVMVDMQKRESR